MDISTNAKLLCDAYQIFPEKGVEAIAHMVAAIGDCESCPQLKDCKVITDRREEDCKEELIIFMEEE